MAHERPTGRLVTGSDAQRELIDHIRPAEIADGPALACRVPTDQPARHHELDREGVSLHLLEIASRLTLHRHPAQYALVVEAGLMSQRKMAEFVGRGEALNAHGAVRRDE